MAVVNVGVKHIRPKYQNLKEWAESKNNVYIGRAGVVFINKQRYPKQSSMFANPYKISKENDRKTVISKYETYIREKLKDEKIMKELLELKGKNLGCWCHPEPCHGDILLKILDELHLIKLIP